MMLELLIEVRSTLWGDKGDESFAENKTQYDHLIENDLTPDKYEDTYYLHDDYHWQRKVFRDNVANFITE